MRFVSAPPYAVRRSTEAFAHALAGVYSWMTVGPVLLLGLAILQVLLVVGIHHAALLVGRRAVVSLFLGYAALTGFTLSTVFLVYTATSIATAFFVAAGGFAGLAALGTLTRRDLGVAARSAWFALIGLMLALAVNFVVGSTALQLGMSALIVVLFSGFTAYDTQKLKELYRSGGVAENFALRGALTLYLDVLGSFGFLQPQRAWTPRTQFDGVRHQRFSPSGSPENVTRASGVSSRVGP